MKKFLAAALSAALLTGACESKNTVKDPATQKDRTKLEEEIRLALPKLRLEAWKVVDFKGDKQGSVFTLSEMADQDGVYFIRILERRDGRFSSLMQDNISYAKDPARKIQSIVTDDMGHDGLEEVKLLLFNGEQRLYSWNGNDYMRADRSMAFRDGWNISYKDIDGDGTEEAIVVRTPSDTELFRAYRWQRGWIPYMPKEFEQLTREYKSVDAGLDALAVMERRTAIRNQLLNRLR